MDPNVWLFAVALSFLEEGSEPQRFAPAAGEPGPLASGGAYIIYIYTYIYIYCMYTYCVYADIVWHMRIKLPYS